MPPASWSRSPARERRTRCGQSSCCGVEGRGWLARAEAEWRRARADNDPAAWLAVVEAFGPGFVYESARSRWRLAEALAEAGRRDEAQREWRLAFEAADRLGAVPLRAALADLARRARLGPACPVRPRRRAWPRIGGRDLAGFSERAAGQSAGRADRPGAGSAPLAGGGPQQQGDRRGAVHRPEDRERARLEHPGQAGREPAGPRRPRSRTATASGCPPPAVTEPVLSQLAPCRAAAARRRGRCRRSGAW